MDFTGIKPGSSLATTANSYDSEKVTTLDQDETQPYDNNDETTGGTNILQLNDDCLRLIFDELKLMDQIAMKHTCTRFEGVASAIFKRYKIFDLDCYSPYQTTIEDAKNILAGLGPFIERISMSRSKLESCDASIWTTMHKYCSGLKMLKLRGFQTFPGLEEVVEPLEGLAIIDCDFENGIAPCLSRAKHLQRLDLSLNQDITGFCLQGVSNLKCLNLAACENISTTQFINFANNNLGLEYLNIDGCFSLGSAAFLHIANNMTELSHLICSARYVCLSSLSQITKLPKLKRAQIKIKHLEGGPCSSTAFLKSLAEANRLEHLDLPETITDPIDYSVLGDMTSLKELKLNHHCLFLDEHLTHLCGSGNFTELHVAGCSGISERHLIEFIGKNPMLTLLDVSHCKVTDNFIFRAIDVLKQRANECRLQVLVGSTKVQPGILQNDLIRSNSHLLEISFDSTDACDLYLMDSISNSSYDSYDQDYDDDDDDDYLHDIYDYQNQFDVNRPFFWTRYNQDSDVLW